MKLKVKLDELAYMPTRAHEADAGLDLYAPITYYVDAHDPAIIDTGVHIEIPRGYVGMIKSKSGLNTKYGLRCEGVIDADYTGSIRVKMYSDEHEHRFERGDKVAQLVLLPIITPELELVDELAPTERGSDGFGSTGR